MNLSVLFSIASLNTVARIGLISVEKCLLKSAVKPSLPGAFPVCSFLIAFATSLGETGYNKLSVWYLTEGREVIIDKKDFISSRDF